MRKLLEAEGKKNGVILVGICKPGVAVLDERAKGFRKGLEGSGFTATDPKDVGTDPTANYAAWENQATAKPDIVAAVGPLLDGHPQSRQTQKPLQREVAYRRVRSQSGDARFDQGGNDADHPRTASLSPGLPAGARPGETSARQKADAQRLLNVNTEIITKANVDTVYPRETDRAAETKWYADDIAKNFSDLNALAKPLPKMHP